MTETENRPVIEIERVGSHTKATNPAQTLGAVMRPVSRVGNALRARIAGRPVPVRPGTTAVIDQVASQSRPYWWSFVLVVILPALAATIYLGFLASDQYQSEARFIVRTVEMDDGGGKEKEDANGLSTATAAAAMSFAISQQDAYIVTSYIGSRAIIDDISNTVNIREIFQRPEADFYARLKRNATIDDLTDYWHSMVAAYVDPTSGIVTVEVTAFRPDDALKLGQAIVDQAEKLVNRMSDRSRLDATKMADAEVKQAFGKVQESLASLQDYRNKVAIIDPGQTSSQIGKLLAPMLVEKLKLENDIAVMGAELDSNAPSQRVLRNRINTLDQQINTLRGQLTGSDTKTVSSYLAKYEELDMQRILNERNYTRAQSALERAELRARRQSIYFSIFVPPTPPEYARYPLRIGYSAMIFGTLLIFWAIGAMIYASIEDHRL